MRKVPIVILLVLSSGCMATSDGPFEQIAGAPIDYAKVDQLAEREATKVQVLAALGSPTHISVGADGTEVIEYASVKQRESVNKTFGISHGRSKQTMEERVTLSFKDGLLVKKEKASTVR